MLLASMPRAVRLCAGLASLLCLAALCSARNRHSDACIDSHCQCEVEPVQTESETWRKWANNHSCAGSSQFGAGTLRIGAPQICRTGSCRCSERRFTSIGSRQDEVRHHWRAQLLGTVPGSLTAIERARRRQFIKTWRAHSSRALERTASAGPRDAPRPTRFQRRRRDGEEPRGVRRPVLDVLGALRGPW